MTCAPWYVECGCPSCAAVDRAVLAELLPLRDASYARLRALEGPAPRSTRAPVAAMALAAATALVLAQCGVG